MKAIVRARQLVGAHPPVRAPVLAAHRILLVARGGMAVAEHHVDRGRRVQTAHAHRRPSDQIGEVPAVLSATASGLLHL